MTAKHLTVKTVKKNETITGQDKIQMEAHLSVKNTKLC